MCGGRGRLAGAGAPARKKFSSLSLKILTPFRINLLIWPPLIFFLAPPHDVPVTPWRNFPVHNTVPGHKFIENTIRMYSNLHQ